MREKKRERGKKMKGGNWCSRVAVTGCVLTTSLACSTPPACRDYHRGHVILNQPCKQGVGGEGQIIRLSSSQAKVHVSLFGVLFTNRCGDRWTAWCGQGWPTSKKLERLWLAYHSELWVCFVYSVFVFFKIKRVKLGHSFAVHDFSFLVTKSLFPFRFNCLRELTTLHLIWRR